jgi:flagellar biosynthetic protein FliR
MALNQALVLTWLGHFLYPFLRVTGLFLIDPLFGSAFIPASVKAVLVAALAAALALWLPDLPAFPADPASALYQGVLQLSYGAVLGCTMQIVVAAIASAGEVAGLAIGLSFAELQYKEASSPIPVLYDIMNWTGLMAYIAVGGPVFLFAALAHSFAGGSAPAAIASWNDLAMLGSTLISSAVWLALPVLAVSLTVNITVGLTTIFAPQLNLLTIGFPLLILSGLWVLLGSTGFMASTIQLLFLQAMDSAAAIARHG